MKSSLKTFKSFILKTFRSIKTLVRFNIFSNFVFFNWLLANVLCLFQIFFFNTHPNCTRRLQANPDTLKRYNCNNNGECVELTGIMACRLGHCSNMSELYQCYYNTNFTGETLIDSDLENLKLNGYFHCNNGKWVRQKQQWLVWAHLPFLRFVCTKKNIQLELRAQIFYYPWL